MALKFKKFEKGGIILIEDASIVQSLLYGIDNPGAMFTRKQVMVINPSNQTFTQEECDQIELLINSEKEGDENVVESRN